MLMAPASSLLAPLGDSRAAYVRSICARSSPPSKANTAATRPSPKARSTNCPTPRSRRIRARALTVAEALHRSLAHASYHVGQIVYVAKALRGADWQSLSIPPGQSARYNQAPALERTPRPLR